MFSSLSENCGQLKTLEIVLKESDHCVGDQDSVSVPEYSELVEGYEVKLAKSCDLVKYKANGRLSVIS